jgi:tetratricopeptide (TPR) repeat protein
MANSSNSPGAVPPGKAGAVKNTDIDPPPSLPLQIFLFCAFLLTVAAYLVGQRTDSATEGEVARRKNETLHRLIEEKSKSMAYTSRGFQEEYQKHYDLAASNFQDALVIQNSAEGHYNLGNALLLQGKRAEALAQFKAALALDPKLRDAYTSWGQALMEQGQAAEAAAVYQQASAQNPDYSLFHFKLALALEAMQKNAEALEESGKAARLGLDDAEFWLDYGVMLSHDGKFAAAETNLIKAAAMRADLPRVQFELALAQEKQGKVKEAIPHYETAISQAADPSVALNNLALIYATAKMAGVRNPKMAVSLATQASRAAGDQNPRYLDTLARSYAADGDFLQAAVWEKKAMDQAAQTGDKDLQGELAARYALFQQHKSE